MYPWFVFLHLLGIFGFLIAHGVSAGVIFALSRERNVDHICLLLKLSSSSVSLMGGSLLVVLLSGIITGFLGLWWSHGWIWLSLALLVGIFAAMSLLGTRVLNQVRVGIGLPSAYGEAPRAKPYSAAELDALLSRLRPVRLASIGLGGFAVIAWLMLFKPF